MDFKNPHFEFCSEFSKENKFHCPMIFEDALLFFSSLGISDFKLKIGSPIGWRCRAKLATRGTSSLPLVGLYEKGTHQVVDHSNYPEHHPSIDHATALVREWISKENISLYDENCGKGLLRYIQLTVERATGCIQLVLVLNVPEHDEASWIIQKKLLESLWLMKPELWHSLWVNFNVRRDNVIFGEAWKQAFGKEWLWERLLGCEVAFHPASFIQANLEMFELMLGKIKTFIPHQAHATEFYAGVGAIGLVIADLCAKVRCVEIVPSAKICFEESVRHLSEDLKKRLSFVSGSANPSLIDEASDVVIVDPPRKGLDPSLLKALCKAPSLHRLIYISCGWESFKRDCKELVKAGWTLSFAEAYLFFPETDLIETLAIFDLF